MKIIDCFTYFDEDVILKIRLNILYNVVDKFIISEGGYDHRGNKRKYNFKIENFKEFADKIIYLPVDKFPNLNYPWAMLKFQRNYCNDLLIKKFNPDDYIIVSDVDEIPNPLKILDFIDKKYKIGVFEQLMFYYKLNLLNSSSPLWHGSKICKLKNLKNPEWLRAYKSKQYSWWRLDKPSNLKIIKKGGWHFSFLYDVNGIIKKISSYQHTEFDIDKIKNKKTIENKINNNLDIFNRNFKYKAIILDNRFPNYILENRKQLQKWISG